MEKSTIRARSPGTVTGTGTATYQVKFHSYIPVIIRHIHSFLARTE